jgi:acetyl esterase/lipase
MRILLTIQFAIAAFLVTANPLHAADDPRVGTLRTADDERVAAIIAADRARLSAIFSDDLHYAHSTGSVDDKASYISLLVTGRAKYHIYEYEKRDFTFPAPGIALMTGRVHIKSTSADGVSDGTLSLLAVWREEQGRWRFLAWQSCRIPQPVRIGTGAFAGESFRVERDVDYLASGHAQKADLYLPKVPDGKHVPAVLIIHGGGWTRGDKAGAREINIATNLAMNGYVGMSINYLLSKRQETNCPWPQNLYECKTAVRWLRANADRLRINPDRIGVIGSSVGGQLAAMVAVAGAEAKLDPAGPYGEFSSRVQCAVVLYGPSENVKDISGWHRSRAQDPELYRVSSPITWVDRGDPPILLLHGTADKVVPVDQSERLAAVLKASGVEHELVLVPGAPHSFHLQLPERDLRPLVLGFLDKHLKQ